LAATQLFRDDVAILLNQLNRYPDLQARFTAAPREGVPPHTVYFTDLSLGHIEGWRWDFGDGTTGTQQHPAHVYRTPGPHTVSLEVFGDDGMNTLDREGYIKIAPYPRPNVSFEATPLSGEMPLTVTFSTHPTGTIDSWRWDFGDGVTSTLQHPVHVYTATGLYTVSLEVTGPGGWRVVQQEEYIRVVQAPHAQFSALPTQGAWPLKVRFTDQSTGYVDHWLWDFGDGITSTLQNPSHTYTTTGQYTVTLAANGLDTSSVITRRAYITVWELFAPAISHPAEESMCDVIMEDIDGDVDLDLVTTNAADDAVMVVFNEGDATFVLTTTYSVGNGPCAMAIEDLDNDDDPDIVTADSYDDTISVLLNSGTGTFVADQTYGLGGSGVNYPRSMVAKDLNGDGSPDLVTANAQNDTITVFYNLGNGAFSSKKIYTVGDYPYAVTTGDLDGDGNPDLAVANSHDNTVSILLNAGNGAFSTHATYNVGYGPFSETMADVDGDGDLDLVTANLSDNTISVLLNQGDGAFASHVAYDVGDEPRSVEAGDLDGDGDLDLVTTNAEDDTLSILINQEDGTFAPAVPQNAGDKPHGLAIGDLDGDDDLDLAVTNLTSHDISILLNQTHPPTPLQADFSAAPRQGLLPLTVHFSDHSSGQVARRLWQFGDGYTSTLRAPTHTYEITGTFDVTLTLYGPYDETVSKTMPGYISSYYVEENRFDIYLPLLLRDHASKQIVFQSTRDHNSEIYVMNLSGNKTRLTNNSTYDGYPIYVMYSDGSAQRRLTNPNFCDAAPSWSPDGSRIAFHTCRNYGQADIYTINFDGSGLTQLTDNLASEISPTWSPDGTRIAFSADYGSGYEIHVMDADGNNETCPTCSPHSTIEDGHHPSWSPDGTRIVFSAQRDGNHDLYVMDDDGSALSRLTYDAASDRRADWRSGR
jgi:PKD repeat protein